MERKVNRIIGAFLAIIILVNFWAIITTCLIYVGLPKEIKTITEYVEIPQTTIIEIETNIVPPIEIVEVERIVPISSDEALEQIELAIQRKTAATNVLNDMAYLGYSDERIVEWADIMIINANADIEYYTNIYNVLYEEEGWVKRTEEHPTATYIWLFLKNQGYNDYVTAGILGNMMTEAGGQSLSINTSASNGSYYGICQWGPNFSGRYTDLDGQLNLLMDTIKREFDNYGTMSYDNFCNLENEQDAALAFARSYERCTSASYSQRQRNATTALNYFTN